MFVYIYIYIYTHNDKHNYNILNVNLDKNIYIYIHRYILVSIDGACPVFKGAPLGTLNHQKTLNSKPQTLTNPKP